MQESRNLKGLRGWLILVGIGLFATAFHLIKMLLEVHYSIFAEGTFTALTTQASSLYNPLWGPILISETLINALMAATYAYLIYLFCTKHYLFPKVYIAAVVVSAIFIPLDAWACSLVLADQPIFDITTAKEMVRALIGLCVWVPYMLVSKRVKATFVERRPESGDTLTTANL
ncbi:DUF2569 domain-containing protein [Pseudomonas trivialis]|uniref:DUF2569 domain-containing protein n=1 Tax=Pseudomonas trivialis TaxID=200450 RepID=A0A0H5ACT6_9PSED|nr:DUF2569 domain-containing protein [Pseudomonas trivialis]AKS08944.1 hypothetical protein AA957_23355 [Pseudomonas trivialis]